MIILQLDSDQLQTIMQNAIRKVIAEQTKQESNSNPLELKDLLTISEASNLLNLAKASIYNLVCQSKIPCMKRGKKLYFSRQELTEWIKQGKKKTINEMQEEADNFLAKKKRG
jgi:excisionase family DNA binding protein